MAKKQYENFMCFGARVYGMKNLWQPSTDFRGQTTKPNWLGGFLVPKTQSHWSMEPVFQNLWGAMQKIHAATMGGLGYEQVTWPIRDGDMPQDPQQPPADWARGQWMFSGNSGDAIKVELSQGATLVPLQARGNIVKPGDFCIVGGAVAVNSQNARAIKLYINNVVFTAPGEEIAIGNSISGAELMQAAQAQGYRPAGFNPSPGGFGGPQNGGFGTAPQGFGGAPQHGGFTAPQGPQNGNGFPGNPHQGPQGGFAPQNTAGPAFGGAQAHGGMPGAPNGNATFPSNQPQQTFPGAATQGGAWPSR
jgi:hypothetical protein